MDDRKQKCAEILARIDALVARSCALPDSDACWEQRLYIDFELVLLSRRLAELFSADTASASHSVRSGAS